MKIVKNDLYDYENRYIYQYEKAFKFSLDSILLAEYVKISKNDKLLVDLCSGNAPVPLIISKKSNIKIIGVEIQKDICMLANKSIVENRLTNQIEMYNMNFNNIFDNLDFNSVDIVTCNPPYFKYGNEKVLNKNVFLTLARHEIKMSLEEVFSVSNKLLTHNGTLYLVHRSNRIDEIILFANRYNLNAKEVVFIKTKENSINIALVKCVKNSKIGISVKMIDVDNVKTYQNIFRSDYN